MNKKQFEIFKTWRVKKYNKDLIKLQEDLAGRGLAMSSIRINEEKDLKDECDSEIEMKRFDSEEYDKERRGKRIERLVFVFTNIILAIVALVSLYASNFKQYEYNQHNNLVNCNKFFR